jgi:hypothetical protein
VLGFGEIQVLLMKFVWNPLVIPKQVQHSIYARIIMCNNLGTKSLASFITMLRTCYMVMIPKIPISQYLKYKVQLIELFKKIFKCK